MYIIKGEGLVMKCPRLGCSKEIRGFTGLHELTNLMKHFKKVHGVRVTMEEAIMFRQVADKIEEENNV